MYRAIYKCRACHEEFAEWDVQNSLYRTVENVADGVDNHPIYAVHICHDFQAGLADFICARDVKLMEALSSEDYAAT